MVARLTWDNIESYEGAEPDGGQRPAFPVQSEVSGRELINASLDSLLESALET
jgi:hypothetical protein